MKELVPMTYQNQKCDQKAISRSQLVYTFRTGTSIPMGKIENVAVKKENAEVRFSLPRRQAEVIDLTKSPPKRRPTTSHSIRVRKSKIPKPPPPTARQSFEEELENIFPDFAASVQRVIMEHEGPKAAYDVSRKIIKFHEELTKN